MDYTMNDKTYESRVSRCCCSMILLASTCVATAHATDAVQWRVEDGGNGHWYIASANRMTFPTALAWTQAAGGHLATIGSAGENAILFDLARTTPEAWVVINGHVANGPFFGAQQLSTNPGYSEPRDGWRWVTGESLGDPYTNFCRSQPDDNSGGGQSVGAFYATGDQQYSCWDDIFDATQFTSLPWTFLVEWDADCNNDGIVDYGQILNGQLADSDADGVPDICETLRVPQDYPTIQAAIDAGGPATPRIIAVAAGTYNESFALNGKDVTVRGAPNNATILDGTGLTTSIARFTGGEPATASLEQLVFRNGISGSLLNPKSTVRLGGAILAHEAFVNLLRCRFEYCSADFGGAAYLYSTTLHAQDCTFTNNSANDEGGAVLSFRTDGGVYSSSFTSNRCGTLSTSSGAAIKLVGGRTSDSIFAIEDCTITGAPVNGVGAAVQQFADSSGVPGVLHIINTSISGHTVDLGAAGLDVIGGMQSCVLSEGTVICNNTVRNVDGPFTIVSNATVCDCLSDMTGDDLVNGFDLSVVLSNWGLTPSSGDGDVNHDGMVDAADLAIALNTWGSCP